MHSSNSSSPPRRRGGQQHGGGHHPGSFFTIPRWMGGGGSGSKKQLQYRSLRSLEDPTATTTSSSVAGVSSSTGRRKRPSLFDQMVKRFFTPHVGHHHNSRGSSSDGWNGGAKYSGPSRSGSLRDLRSRAVGGDPGGGDDGFFTGKRQDGGSSSALPRTHVPAVAGIRNEGNTCFMNAVLQCLSNTDAFAEYLVSRTYRQDFAEARGGRGFASSSGGGGCASGGSTSALVTEQLAHVLSALWSCRTDGDFAARFKACVEKHGSQYQGSEQHDAQEFLMWLLDKVHEELADDSTACTSGSGATASSRTKRGSLKRSKNRPSATSRGTGSAAAVTTPWQGSPVALLFAGQLRLRLTCPRCSQQSNTFDPFVCLSLPIPAASQWLCNVHLVPRNSPPTKLAFHMDFGAMMDQVRLRISTECHIPLDQLLLLEETKEGFGTLFEGDEVASAISANSRLVALELPPASTDPTMPKDSQILVLCRSRVGSSGSCLGATRAAWVSREVSGMELKKKLLEGLPTSRQSALKDQDLVDRLDVLVWDAHQSLPSDVDHPLFLEFVDCLLEASRDLAPAPLLRVMLQWEPQVADRLFLAEDSIMDDIGTSQQELEPSVLLSDCLAFYFTEEKLEPEEAWLCPQCDSRQQCFAQLGLWLCPEILVIHLKRFHQNGGRHSKLATRVEVPLQDLDLSGHLCQGAAVSGGALYDLYAFCSHHGSGLQGGHYTACCKNPVDEQWYLFDDARVRRALDEDLVARDAYLLFYQRQPPMSRVARSRSNPPRHWFIRTPLLTSRSHQQLVRGSPSRSSSIPPPAVRGEPTSFPCASSLTNSGNIDVAPQSAGSSSSLSPSGHEFVPDSSCSSSAQKLDSSFTTASPIAERPNRLDSSLTRTSRRDGLTEKSSHRLSPPPSTSPTKSSPTRASRSSSYRPRPTYLCTTSSYLTRGSLPKKVGGCGGGGQNAGVVASTATLRAKSPAAKLTWNFDSLPAGQQAADVTSSAAARKGRVALLAAKFSQPDESASSKWPYKFPESGSGSLLPERTSSLGQGTYSPVVSDENLSRPSSFTPINGLAAHQSHSNRSSPAALSPEALSRRVLSPRVPRTSRQLQSQNTSFGCEKDITSDEHRSAPMTEDATAPSALKEAFWTITSV